MAIRKVISRSIEDNTVAAADFQGAVNSLSNAGNLTFSSTGQRIRGDMSNSTIANRVIFQSSTTNGATNLELIPNGTSTATFFVAESSSSDPANGSSTYMSCTGTESQLVAHKRGTGTYLPLTINTGGSERLRIDTSGNVGIGRTTAIGTNCRLNVQLAGTSASGYTAATNAGIALDCGTGTNGVVNLVGGGELGIYRTNTSGAYDVGIGFGTNADRILRFDTASAERMRITSSGALLVGTTTAPQTASKFAVGNFDTVGANYGVSFTDGNDVFFIRSSTTISTNSAHYQFINPNGTVGGINTNGTATSFLTSSDYRLKENITPMTGALDTVQALKPCTYTWKADGSDGQGFIAHELAEVMPDAVAGEKDAVDADGNPVYQGVDTSFLVATLAAAIQELKAENDALKVRLDAAGL
jgi:hypothetical protein